MKKIILFHLIFIFFIFSCASEQRAERIRGIADNIKGEPVVPRHANRIYVATFKNGHPDSMINDRLLIKIKQKINTDVRLALADENDFPDLVLDGRVSEFYIQPVEFDTMGVAIKKRIRITVSVKMTDVQKKRLIFSDNNVYAFRMFSEYRAPVETEDDALDKLLEDLSGRIFSKIETGWFTDKMTPAEKGK